MSTTFFRTYWPSSVGPAAVNSSLGKNTSGDRMPTNATASITSPNRANTPEMRASPATVSMTAVRMSASWPPTTPKVSTPHVASTSGSRGLAPGKNFSTPNATNTAPRATRRAGMLHR